MKKYVWLAWLLITAGIAGFYGFKMFIDPDKQSLLVGEPTWGHHQIEMACTACHSEAFGGKDTLQNACINCHGAELEAAQDSHPRKKFTDPRNADRLDVLDARYCITCHIEHQQEHTRIMGVTLPDDYCYHCHQDVSEERPSHQDLEFNSCASAGCHNYHDNRALYEDFLAANAMGEWLKNIREIPLPQAAAVGTASLDIQRFPRFSDKQQLHSEQHREWLASSHAQAGVSCGACHSNDDGDWLDKPKLTQCDTCHDKEAEGFLAGKHGMRLARGLEAITPAEAKLPMKPHSRDTQHSCVACHSAHDFDTQRAAVAACLNCHDDTHSLAFEQSPHGKLAARAAAGELPPEQAVTCATCHMPRRPISAKVDAVLGVEHNQNMHLRPNEKMIRPICMQCHSLGFAIDALADKKLIDKNFAGRPAKHVPSIDWAVKREQTP